MKNMKGMRDRHKWAKYEMDDEDRPYYNPRFGGNLKVLFEGFWKVWGGFVSGCLGIIQ